MSETRLEVKGNCRVLQRNSKEMLHKTVELPPYPCHENSEDSKEAAGVLELTEEEVGGERTRKMCKVGWGGITRGASEKRKI